MVRGVNILVTPNVDPQGLYLPTVLVGGIWRENTGLFAYWLAPSFHAKAYFASSTLSDLYISDLFFSFCASSLVSESVVGFSLVLGPSSIVDLEKTTR